MAISPSSAYASEGQKRRLDLTALYRTHHKKLTAYVRKQQDVFDAEDIVQELFERLVNSRSAHHIRRPSTYLFATARHVIVDCHRRQYAESRTYAALYSTEAEIEFSPDRLLEGRIRLMAVLHTIIHLPEEKCLVFLLARFDDMTVREISAYLRIPRSTVQDYINEAMQACQNAAIV